MVFVLNWERPIYLWTCLDTFYRHTTAEARFVFADNASTDPGVAPVIDAFERRGMFHAVYRGATNDPMRFPRMIEDHWDEIGDYLVLLEADTAILESDPCWLSIMTQEMDRDPEIGSLGSRVYQPDFVPLKEARRLRPDLSEEDLAFLIKAKAPMRRYVHTDEPLVSPHNPPLRLLMMRKTAYEEVGFGRDTLIHKRMKQAGWKSLISTRVVHRHLSLLNIYDYPEYGRGHRNAFFNRQAKDKSRKGPG